MFAALDLSLTAIGWARTLTASGSGRAVGLIHPKGEGVRRLQNGLNQVLRAVTGSRLVLIEGYAYGADHQAHQLGEMGGVIRLGLHQSGIPWVEVPPSCVKKLATGNGAASKDAVFAAAIRRLGYEGLSKDEADALWLLQAARIHYGHPAAPDLPASHLQFLGKVKWPVLEAA